MPLPFAGDSSSSDSCNEDRNASQQRGKLVEGQSFRTGARSTHVERRAYNLRPRKDDPVAIQKRSEFARLRREQQNQRRTKREEATRVYEEFNHNKLRFEEPPEESDEDFEFRTEVITGGINPKLAENGANILKPRILGFSKLR